MRIILLSLIFVKFIGTGQLNGIAEVEYAMKHIIQSCYKNYKSPHPIVLFGQFNDYTNELSSVLQSLPYVTIDESGPINIQPSSISSIHFKADTVILLKSSSEQLQVDLLSLKTTQWWNHMARFFILERYADNCNNFSDLSNITLDVNIVNVVYICADLKNNVSLYTLNHIADYAPQPWQKTNSSQVNVYRHSTYPSNVSCSNLHYNKLRVLHHFKINALFHKHKKMKRNTNKPLLGHLDWLILELVTKSINATYNVTTEPPGPPCIKRLVNGQSDWLVSFELMEWNIGLPPSFPFYWSEILLVRKTSGYMSTLAKILSLFTPSTICLESIIFLMFSISLMIINGRGFSYAALDVIRLLTDTSLVTRIDKLAWRIFFATILINVVLTNGIFQSSIASFLTKPHEIKGVDTIEEIKRLRWKIFTSPGTKQHVRNECPNNEIIEIEGDICDEYLHNQTNAICVSLREFYYEYYNTSSTTILKEVVRSTYLNSKFRHDWPMYERINNMMIRMYESGITDCWLKKIYLIPKLKDQADQIDRESAKYEPVHLEALKFSFQLLSIGLSIAFIVFLLEVIWIPLTSISA